MLISKRAQRPMHAYACVLPKVARQYGDGFLQGQLLLQYARHACCQSDVYKSYVHTVLCTYLGMVSKTVRFN